MKLMKDMTRTEVIELIGAIIIRVWSGSYFLSVIVSALISIVVVCEKHFTASSVSSAVSSSIDLVLMNSAIMLALNALVAFPLFYWAVPLARLVCDGLSPSLETSPKANLP